MMWRSRRVTGILAGALTACASIAFGQDFPNKPVRFVASGIGGGSDFTARLIGQAISGPLGHSVIVENRPGVLQGEVVAKSPPDGYTVLIAGGQVFITPLLQKTSYDPERDFAAVTLTDTSPNILTVHPSVPAKSVKELIALAKARPGELNYGSTAAGGSIHLATELFKSMAGINIVNIPYKATGLAVNDLMGGQLHLMISTALSVTPQMKSGRLRGLAVTSAQPSALAPGLPAIAASGLPGYEAVGITGAYVPTKTPTAIVNRLNQEIVRYLSTPEAKEKFLNVGGEVAPATPEQSNAIVKADIARWTRIIKEVGIRAQ
jgi:tripartite-type tricarboxylate transporter receptor subunit TctC